MTMSTLEQAIYDYRLARQTELYDFAEVLQSTTTFPDTGPVSTAAGMCLGAPKKSVTANGERLPTWWQYELVGLQVQVDDLRHARPRATDGVGLIGRLSVVVQEYLPEDVSTVGASLELTRCIQLDFHIKSQMLLEAPGRSGGDVELHDLCAAWHGDTQVSWYTDGRHVHPRHHLQFGGERLDSYDESIRGIFIPEAPRVVLPPMDAVLAVDFVLSNYCGPQWKRLCETPRYRSMVTSAMKRYWLPYYKTIAGVLESAETSGDQTKMACEFVPNLACLWD